MPPAASSLFARNMLINSLNEGIYRELHHIHSYPSCSLEDVPTALHSSMPSLRKLVKPTDWERVRSRVVRFAEKAWRDPSRPHSMQMNPMTIQLPGLTGWFSVDEAGLHHHHGEKLWLHLRGFRPQKPRRSSKMPSLSEIQEGDQLSGL